VVTGATPESLPDLADRIAALTPDVRQTDSTGLVRAKPRPMTVVVDTSVAVKWFMKETGREQALRVLGARERHAPDLIVAEVGNVAWKKAILGEITGAQARFICASLTRYFVVLHRSEALIDRAVDIALRLRHPIYDCL
jgi:predicted nucleic acid-binding protein